MHVMLSTPPGSTVRVTSRGEHGYAPGSLFDLMLVSDSGIALVKTGHDESDWIPIAFLEVVPRVEAAPALAGAVADALADHLIGAMLKTGTTYGEDSNAPVIVSVERGYVLARCDGHVFKVTVDVVEVQS